MSANQIEFVDLIVEHLTEHGVVEAERLRPRPPLQPAELKWGRRSFLEDRLYESPFTDLTPRGPDGIFASTEVDQLLQILDSIRAAATAA